jgi:hypothetical protein
MSERPLIDERRFAEVYARYRDRELHDMDISSSWNAQLGQGESVPVLPGRTR